LDISLCAYVPEKGELYFTGAQRSIVHISNGEFNEYRGSSYPIGGWQLEEKREFPSIKLDVQEGDMLYLGSDGFQDQFGGEKGKKFNRKKLNKLFMSIYKLPLIQQKEIMESTFREWKGTQEQIDDVCVAGIRL
ncbi:MAG: PP2C family protein-serine/threonine phosphatase, partial [Flavobacteriales bacterium]